VNQIARIRDLRYDGSVREPFQNQLKPANDSNLVRAASPSLRTGFTLIELLICMALIIVMFTMLWGFDSSRNQSGQKKRCQSNLQKMYLALEIYARDNRDDFPFFPAAQKPADALDVLVPKYSADTSIFTCPGGKYPVIPSGEPLRGKQIGYAYYMGRRLPESIEPLLSDQQVNTQSKTNGQLVFSATGKPPGNNHHKYGGNFLFCDGRVEESPASAAFPLVLKSHVVLLNP
jgi:prepilin-type N-terminal cleavage/methylation domain-containing protein/prepilin-type processing-associated H-X9-DG protein